MYITNLHINNFKSLLDVNILEPAPFTVFVGPNGAGKSNIFEALEYLNLSSKIQDGDTARLFGGTSSIVNVKYTLAPVLITLHSSTEIIGIQRRFFSDRSYESMSAGEYDEEALKKLEKTDQKRYKDYIQLHQNFSRLFINNHSLVKLPFKDDSRLALDAGNLEKVLKRILQDENKREEMTEWLQLLVPGFERISVHSDTISGIDTFLIYEKGTDKPFTKSLISDGTYNILALLTAIYQSDEPQFLCIEEPENGLNPKVIRELVGLFRSQCEAKGHYIWLNTHSQTLVAELTPEEIILVDKVDGSTQIKQLKVSDLHGLRMDKAWLTNALGGGLPW